MVLLSRRPDGSQGLTPITIPGAAAPWLDVACAYHATYAMAADGTIYGVGYNGYGQLGDGSTTDRHSLVAIGGLGADPGAKLAHGGRDSYHMIVIAPDGTARGTGKNDHTQLGGELSSDVTTPAPLAALGEGIVDAYRGYSFTVLLKRGA